MAQAPENAAPIKAGAISPLSPADSAAIQAIAQALTAKRTTWRRIGDAALATAPTTTVALIGLYAVHRLSVRRQRRDEFFKLQQSSQEQVRSITADAVKVWSPEGAASNDLDPTADELTTRVSRVSAQLAMLARRQRKFSVQSAVVAYRQAVTTDIEAQPRIGSVQRTGNIRATGLALEAAIEEQYLALFG